MRITSTRTTANQVMSPLLAIALIVCLVHQPAIHLISAEETQASPSASSASSSSGQSFGSEGSSSSSAASLAASGRTTSNGGSSSSTAAAAAAGSTSSGSGSSSASSGSSGSGSSGSSSSSSAASASGSTGSSESSSASAASSSESRDTGAGTTSKPSGLFGKISDFMKKGKEIVTEKKEQLEQKKEEIKEKLDIGRKDEGLVTKIGRVATKSVELTKENVSKGVESARESMSKGIESSKETMSKSFDSVKETAHKFENKVEKASDSLKEGIKDTVFKPAEKALETKEEKEKKGGFLSKIGSLLGGGEKNEEGIIDKGTDKVRDAAHKVEDSTRNVSEKAHKSLEDNVLKPMQQVGGSGTKTSEAKASAHASASSRSSLFKQEGQKGSHGDDKSVAVEVFDKAHDVARAPVEKVLKPLDRMLGVEKDPIIKLYDNSHDLLRKPLSLVAKPVETVLTGAFKTTDEAKKESERLLAASSEQERKEAKQKEEQRKKENRSVVGDIIDKNVELATKPIEIALKPLDHAFGFDKKGKKNPLLQVLDEIYGLSKKPVDALAKPLESILRKMAEGEQLYQISIRVNGEESSDPKLMTRLADGALNIADRVITGPLEVLMKPLDYALGYDAPGKKNPIVEAAHSLKNATKVGVELWTKPIDRIIKEIAEIGAIQDEAEREERYKLKREEASRIVKALDKIHEVAQTPFEIVLRPITKSLGINKDGKKEPLLRAWDIIHQVLRTPIQVFSKPLEDALLGEQKKKPKSKEQLKALEAAKKAPKEGKKNIFIQGIKKLERLIVKPVDVMTSPVRRLVLGEDEMKAGTEVNGDPAQKNKGGKSQGPDKIVKTVEDVNNLVLKPLELLTQPLSDMLNNDDNKKDDKKDKKSGGGGAGSSGSASKAAASGGSSTTAASTSVSTGNGKSLGISVAASSSQQQNPPQQQQHHQ